MRYCYTFLDSVEREQDIELTSDVFHTQQELDDASREAYLLAKEHNAANPELDEDGEPYEDDSEPDDGQVLEFLTEQVLPDLEYVKTSGYLMNPRGRA